MILRVELLIFCLVGFLVPETNGSIKVKIMNRFQGVIEMDLLHILQTAVRPFMHSFVGLNKKTE